MHNGLDTNVCDMHIAGMKLADWMTETGETDATLCAKVGRDRSTVTRWRLGQTRPDYDAMAALETVTIGQVTYKDFAERAA